MADILSSATSSTGAGGGGADPITAIANALGDLFGLINTALQPGIVATQAYFAMLVNAQMKFQNPFADSQAASRKNNTLLLYIGAAIIMMLLLAIIVKRSKK